LSTAVENGGGGRLKTVELGYEKGAAIKRWAMSSRVAGVAAPVRLGTISLN
jgi:hypothetical protein